METKPSDKTRDIPLSAPNLDMSIAENLRECIKTGWISTSGPYIDEFEDKMAGYIGASETVACQSGTAAIHTALRILGVGAGDLVICPALSFIAAVNPVRYLGADPVFIDCDRYFCMAPDKLELYLSEGCRMERDGEESGMTAGTDSGSEPGMTVATHGMTKPVSGVMIDKQSCRRVRAIIVVHVFGYLANMKRIMDIADRYHVKVLEDASESVGSFWVDAGSGKPALHSGLAGDMGVYSFNANKIITTGGGGMIVAGGCGDPKRGERAREYLKRARYLTSTAKDDPLYFTHDDVGYNYRMLNIQAALGLSQADEIEGFISVKKGNHALYTELLADEPGLYMLPMQDESRVRSNHWFYCLYVCGSARDDLMLYLISRGIQCRPVWRLCNRQKAYEDCGRGELPQAEDYESHVLNLPCSSNLPEIDVSYICGMIKEWNGRRRRDRID